MKSNLPIDEIKRRKREKILICIIIPIIILLLIVEYLLLKNSIHLPKLSNLVVFALININTILLLLLAFLILRNLVKLIFEDKSKILGAKLRTKLVTTFFVLSFIPTILLFFVSIQFLSTSLNYWFDIKVENSLKDAIELGRYFYDLKLKDLNATTENISKIIENNCEVYNFNKACIEEISNKKIKTLFNSNKINSLEIILPTYERIICLYKRPLIKPPISPSVSILSKCFKGEESYITTKILSNGELLRILKPLKNKKGDIYAILVIGSTIPSKISKLLCGIKSGYIDYKQLLLYKNPVKLSLFSILCLITLLILFSSIWYGFRLAKGITEPVRMLAEATYRIAEGDLDFKLETQGRDELHSLVKAFNTMTQELKEAKTRAEEANAKLRRSNVELEQRRHYMEVILQNVAAGIISLNSSGIITIMNRSAESILDLPSNAVIGRHYSELLTPEQREQFEQIKRELLTSERATIQRSIKIVIGQKPLSLLVSFSLLKDQRGNELGMVLVFDDLTELERIQRIAAWREVARRIAHEVKNPLTPIKLSAQRLKKRYIDHIKGEEEKEVFDRCISTIVSQVEELRRLVNEFSKFARMPAPQLKPASIETIAEEVLELYKQAHKDIKFTIDAQNDIPKILLDKEQIKRAFINLLDNAVASIEGEGEVKIEIFKDEIARNLIVVISDTGHGISDQDKARLFEPYFSTKQGGTGLGLAIVNTIIQDHSGTIRVEDNKPKGTKFIITFPITT